MRGDCPLIFVIFADLRSGPISVGCKTLYVFISCLYLCLYFLILGRGCFFPPLWRLVRPNQDGERGERLTNTLFGAKDGGHHHRKRTSTLKSLCRMRRRCT